MGISRALVTKALHRSSRTRVSDETRNEILRVAQQLGYQPRNITTRNIGYVISLDQLQLEGETNFLRYVQQALRRYGYRLTLADFDAANPQALRDVLNRKTVDGVLLTQWFDGRVLEVLGDDVPMMLTTDEYGLSEEFDLVAVEARSTLATLTKHLLAYGHEQFCLVIGAGHVKYHHRIAQGVCDALRDANLDESHLRIVEVSNNASIAPLLTKAMRRKNRSTAVIAANPSQAVPALFALLEAGYKVPADVSLVSSVDSSQFTVLRPHLTATTMAGLEIAERAVQRLVQKIENPALPPQRIFVAGEIIERDSVAKCACNLKDRPQS